MPCRMIGDRQGLTCCMQVLPWACTTSKPASQARTPRYPRNPHIIPDPTHMRARTSCHARGARASMHSSYTSTQVYALPAGTSNLMEDTHTSAHTRTTHLRGCRPPRPCCRPARPISHCCPTAQYMHGRCEPHGTVDAWVASCLHTRSLVEGHIHGTVAGDQLHAGRCRHDGSTHPALSQGSFQAVCGCC